MASERNDTVRRGNGKHSFVCWVSAFEGQDHPRSCGVLLASQRTLLALAPHALAQRTSRSSCTDP